ncbi:helix-turn-helix transcriptional regulator [Nocardioides sp. GXZ039]|uniref:helix-turn-helix transcriptional regulator n=1 Tax=Nocardioides sp. GXZ039 TaxID=3136018 RepID=UPI0030F467D3
MADYRSTVRSAEALGGAIARLRFERGLTQEDLAEALGVSRRYIYEIESGKPNLFALRLFEALRELGAHLEVVAVDVDGPDR